MENLVRNSVIAFVAGFIGGAALEIYILHKRKEETKKPKIVRITMDKEMYKKFTNKELET